MSDVDHDVRPLPGDDGADGGADRPGVITGGALDIRLLGGCLLGAPGQHEIRIASRKGRALIAYLALAPRMQAGREQLAALLWGDRPEAQARQSLRQCLIALRKDLGPQSAALVTTTELVALDSGAVSVDVVRLQELVATDADQALALDQGPFLKDLNIDAEPFMAWVAGERERIERMVTRATEGRIERLDAAGHGRQAVAVAETLVARDPLREDWQRRLLRLYAGHNCREVALAHADELVANLKHELGAEPEPATRALISDIFNNELTPERRSATPFAPDGAAEHSHPAPSQIERPPRHRAAIASWLGAAALSAGLVAIAIHWQRSPEQGSTPISPPDAAVEQMARAAEFVPLAVAVEPARVEPPAGPSTQGFATQLRAHLADRLSQFSDLNVVPLRLNASQHAEYLVEPEIQSQDGAMRIVAHVADAASGHWTIVDQIDAVDPSADPEQLARRLARQIDNKVYALEARKPDNEMRGGQLLIKARAAIDRGIGHENDAESRRYFEEALRINPNSTRAMVGVAKAMLEDSFYYLGRPVDMDRIDNLLRMAVEKEPNAEYVHFWIGNLHHRRDERELALASFQRVIELNPSFASAYAQSGLMLMQLGHPDAAIEKLDYAMWLSPNDHYMGIWMTHRAHIEFNQGHDRAALEILQKAVTRFPAAPRTYGLIAAAHAFLGNSDIAADFAAEFLQLSTPGSSAGLLKEFSGERFNQHPELVRRLQDALDQARRLNIGAVATP